MTAEPGCAVFDLDGTLVDSARHCTLVMNEMLVERGSGLRLTVELTRGHMALGGERMIQALFGDDGVDPATEIQDFRARYRATQMEKASLFPGVETGLRELASHGWRLAVCSNKPQDLCEKTLDDLALLGLFDAVTGARRGMPLKPDPALLVHTLKSLGADTRRSCYIGDDRVDCEAAAGAGVPFILAAYGYGAADVPRASAGRRADSFAGVPEQASRAVAVGTAQAVPNPLTGAGCE